MSKWNAQVGDVVLFRDEPDKDIIIEITKDKITTAFLIERIKGERFVWSLDHFFKVYRLDKDFIKKKQWDEEISSFLTEEKI